MSEIRCGWCITGDCDNCQVVVEMGARNDSGRRVPGALRYFWECQCPAGPHPADRCVDCHRTPEDPTTAKVEHPPNVVLVDHRCADLEDCRRYRKRLRSCKRVNPAHILETAS